MSGNSYKAQKRSRSIISGIVIVIIVYLLAVTSYDAFIATPAKTEKVQVVYEKFMDMKTYLDAKLPEIDTALFKHEQQIRDQNEQLEELNKLTTVLREDKEE